jgi:D-alanyl-D-alanine carboxypeptidase (penicillin-binding protein 5/6)
LSTKRFWITALLACVVVYGLLGAPPPKPPDRIAPPFAETTAARNISPPEVTCESCIVRDDRGRVLFRRRANDRRANASTTKMVTALVVVRAARASEEVTVSPTAAAVGRGGLDLQAGDRYSVKELLYALLMSSSNDSAVALAEHVAASEQAFVEKMNSLASSIGARDTRFVTAHGLDTPGHYSTATDLGTIGTALLEHPLLARIVATPKKVVHGSRGPEVVQNRNLLLESYSGAIGIKTGFTALAGNVLVSAARRRHRTVIAVAMGSVDAAADAAMLLDYGFARLNQTLLLDEGDAVGALVWPSGHATTVIAGSPVRGLADEARIVISLEPAAGPSVTAGDPVGTIVVSTGRRKLARIEGLAADTVGTDARSWTADTLAAVVRVAAGVAGRI